MRRNDNHKIREMKKYLMFVFFTMISSLSFSKDIKLKEGEGIYTRRISLNGNVWRIAIDSNDVGRQNS
jgi:hypothetical protein